MVCVIIKIWFEICLGFFAILTCLLGKLLNSDKIHISLAQQTFIVLYLVRLDTILNILRKKTTGGTHNNFFFLFYDAHITIRR